METLETKKADLWYAVTNTPGVDIRHKVDGQELALVEHANSQIANKIIRAVNSHEALLGASKDWLEYMDVKGMDPEQRDVVRKVIAKAEGKP